MAVGVCEIAFCVNDSWAIVGTMRDLPEREGDAVTYVSLHVCEGHRAAFDADPDHLAVDATNVLIVRPARKPADWCRFCDGPCEVGHPSQERFHGEGGE